MLHFRSRNFIVACCDKVNSRRVTADFELVGRQRRRFDSFGKIIVYLAANIDEFSGWLLKYLKIRWLIAVNYGEPVWFDSCNAVCVFFREFRYDRQFPELDSNWTILLKRWDATNTKKRHSCGTCPQLFCWLFSIHHMNATAIPIFSFFLYFMCRLLLSSALSLHWLCFTCWTSVCARDWVCVCAHSASVSYAIRCTTMCVRVYVEQHLHALKCLNPRLMWSNCCECDVSAACCHTTKPSHRMSVRLCVCERVFIYPTHMLVWVGFSLKVNQCARWFRLVERETTNCADTKRNKSRVWGALTVNRLRFSSVKNKKVKSK